MQPPPTGGWTRQTRATLGTGGALLVAGAAWTAWLVSGSRLALFVCFAGLFAIALDLALAVLATRRVRATVDATPTDASVGDTVPFTLSVTGPRLLFQVRVLDKGQLLVASPPATGRLVGVADRRELVTELEVEVGASGLCGLVTCAGASACRCPVRWRWGPVPSLRRIRSLSCSGRGVKGRSVRRP